MLKEVPEDIRKMSEEQFVEAFEMLRERTGDWRESIHELLVVDPQLLLIFRCTLGLSQPDLAKKLGIHRTRLQDLESGRSRYQKIIWSISERIEDLLKETESSLELALATFRIFKIVSHKESFRQDKNSLQEISKEELRLWFEEIREKTKDFSVFSPLVLVDSPRSILIFRLLLGKFVCEFCKILQVDESTIRGWEHGKQGISLKTSVRVMKTIESFFIKFKSQPKFEDLLPLFIKTREGRTLSLEFSRKRGLIFAKQLQFTKDEEEVKDMLVEQGIEFEAHGIVEGLKRSHSVDFVIPHSTRPQIVIECFKCSSKPLGALLRLVRDHDHRFQMLKGRHPDIKTVLCIDLGEREVIEDEVSELVWLEVLSTDFVLIGEGVKKLPEVISRIITK